MHTPFYTKLAHILICIVGLFYIAILGNTILAPICFALLFSLLLMPVAAFFEFRARMPRALAALLSVISLIIVISSIIYLLISQLGALTQDIPAFRAHLQSSIASAQDWVSGTFHINNSKQMNYLNHAANEAVSKGSGILGATLLSASSLILFLIFTFLYTFLILVYRRLLLRFIVALFNESHASTVHEVVARIRYIIRKYVTGLLLQMLIVTILACTIFWIMGIKYAFLLGLITGIFNVIPYLGIFSALLLSALVTFATMDISNVLFVLIAVFGLHIVDANFIMPRIVGSKVKINPIAALLALVIGEMTWGIKGMFLAIPVIAVCKVIFDRVDGLQPWGIFLGEEERDPEAVIAPAPAPKKRRKKRPPRRKPPTDTLKS